MAEPLTPEEAMREAFRLDVHTPHAILNRLRQMGYTVTPDSASDATPGLTAARATVAAMVKRQPDDSHGDGYWNAGVSAALRVLDLMLDAPCDLRPTGYGQWCELHVCPVGNDAEHDLVDGRCLAYRRAALASEPVPATPACICGRAVPVAGTCFDIDGAYWSGHGEPVPATGNPENPVTFTLDVLDAMHEVALQIGLDLVGHFDRDHTKAETRDAMGDISIRLSKWANVFQRLGHSTVNGRNTPPTRYMRHMAAGAPPPPAEDVIENALRSATGNPEEIDVEALGRFLHDSICSRNAAHFPDDDISRCYALAREYARQREGEQG